MIYQGMCQCGCARKQAEACGVHYHDSQPEVGQRDEVKEKIEEIAKEIADKFLMELTARACESSEQEPLDYREGKALLSTYIVAAITKVVKEAVEDCCVENQKDLIVIVNEAIAQERERIIKFCENVYGDDVGALAGDEPKEVGRKIAAAIREEIVIGPEGNLRASEVGNEPPSVDGKDR